MGGITRGKGMQQISWVETAMACISGRGPVRGKNAVEAVGLAVSGVFVGAALLSNLQSIS